MKTLKLNLLKRMTFIILSVFITLSACKKDDDPIDENKTPPVAAFSADTTTINIGGSINFTDESTNSPTSWNWTFEGGDPSTSSSQNPTVTYNTAGTYTVTLEVTNADGSDTKTKTGYITVSEASSGESAFSCKIDGVSYIGGWKIGGSVIFEPATAYYNTSNVLIIQSFSSDSKSVTLNFSNITNTGTFVLNSVLSSGNWGTTTIGTTGYSSDNTNTGTATITKFDLANNKVSGTFSFNAQQITPSVGSTVVNVTEGSFTDVSITLN